MWKTVGTVEIGPKQRGDNTKRQQEGDSSGPEVDAMTYKTWYINNEFLIAVLL